MGFNGRDGQLYPIDEKQKTKEKRFLMGEFQDV